MSGSLNQQSGWRCPRRGLMNTFYGDQSLLVSMYEC